MKGYLLTKYSKSAFNPHPKRVYLDAKSQELRWQDEGETKKYKFINLKDILEIKQGMIGQGIKDHLTIGKIKDKNCFVTI